MNLRLIFLTIFSLIFLSELHSQDIGPGNTTQIDTFLTKTRVTILGSIEDLKADRSNLSTATKANKSYMETYIGDTFVEFVKFVNSFVRHKDDFHDAIAFFSPDTNFTGTKDGATLDTLTNGNDEFYSFASSGDTEALVLKIVTPDSSTLDSIWVLTAVNGASGDSIAWRIGINAMQNTYAPDNVFSSSTFVSSLHSSDPEDMGSNNYFRWIKFSTTDEMDDLKAQWEDNGDIKIIQVERDNTISNNVSAAAGFFGIRIFWNLSLTD